MARLSTVTLAVMVGSALGHGANEANLPKGLIFENATEIEQELKRNAQFEQEWKEGNYISDLNVSYSMSNCDQECDEWCWATSATMCASAFGASGSCNRNEEKVAGHEFGRQCDSRCSSSCDRPGNSNNIVDGIKLLSGHSYTVGGVLSQSNLDSALRHGPVVMLVRWNGGGGHAITISGGSGGKYHGHDPEGYPINTNYGGLTSYHPSYGGRGKWAQSVYTNSGPSPGPSPSPPPSGCTDQPQNWKSSEGDSCSVYVSYQYCTPDGREGPGWRHQRWGPITNYADSHGRSALDACCGCGGGSSHVAIASTSSLGDYMSSWVKSQEGKRVGSDATHHKQTECWDLAMAAIEHAKKNGFSIPRGPSSYVWSSETVSYKHAQPGDIVQFVSWKEKVTYPDGSWSTKSTGTHHTAVVTSSWDSKTCGLQVEEQNPDPVHQGVYHPCKPEHISGSLVIYRLSTTFQWSFQKGAWPVPAEFQEHTETVHV